MPPAYSGGNLFEVAATTFFAFDDYFTGGVGENDHVVGIVEIACSALPCFRCFLA